ncbi:hypothetical protein Pryu01_01479 [Paraliobacillus ryukyuensis]|uniref:Uncharacterized protein n=1 Tax=Paraliobacillus ryukyuensis TaxID=200904 RepID=A0A366EBX1_9BACI|nr:hypothetical protein [Paraliobacillus ryukyuensis]RBO99822.1 hypothetical protein DES48_103149 [Paraliobacillus ryukyuensis]
MSNQNLISLFTYHVGCVEIILFVTIQAGFPHHRTFNDLYINEK